MACVFKLSSLFCIFVLRNERYSSIPLYISISKYSVQIYREICSCINFLFQHIIVRTTYFIHTNCHIGKIQWKKISHFNDSCYDFLKFLFLPLCLFSLFSFLTFFIIDVQRTFCSLFHFFYQLSYLALATFSLSLLSFSLFWI